MDTKRVFNLRLEANLIADMKIQAIKENRSVSEIATELFRELGHSSIKITVDVHGHLGSRRKPASCKSAAHSARTATQAHPAIKQEKEAI